MVTALEPVAVPPVVVRLAVRVMVTDAAVVGVPVRVPVLGFTVSQLGSELAPKAVGLPVAVMVAVKAWPTLPNRLLVVVITGRTIRLPVAVPW